MLGMEEGEERETAGWSGGGSIEKQQKREDMGKPKGIMMQKGRRKMILHLNRGEEEGRKFQPKATNHNNQNWHGQKTVPTTIKMQMDKGKRMQIGKLERNAGQLWKR
jgi:hypothetical protein